MTVNMKKAISVFGMVLMAACLGFNASAQRECKEEWKKKVRAEKIEFLKAELGLTQEEADTFWPLYNQVEEEKDAATREVIRSFKRLRHANEEGQSSAVLSGLLEEYIAAQKMQRETENGIAERYKAVLPVEKVVKLYMAEEKFRRQHIRNFRGAPKDQSDRKPGEKK